jgi:hypothetical protein
MLPILALRELDLTQTEAKRPREEGGDGPDEVGEEDAGDDDEDEDLTESMRIVKSGQSFTERVDALLARANQLLDDVDRGGPAGDSGGQWDEMDVTDWLFEIVDATSALLLDGEVEALREVQARAQRLL